MQWLRRIGRTTRPISAPYRFKLSTFIMAAVSRSGRGTSIGTLSYPDVSASIAPCQSVRTGTHHLREGDREASIYRIEGKIWRHDGCPLLIVDLQEGFINDFTRHTLSWVRSLIELNHDDYAPLLFTRFVNVEGSPFRRFVGWHDCASSPETDLFPEMAPYAREKLTFSKPGYAGISDTLATYLQDQQVKRVSIVGIDTDMCVLKVALDIFDLNIEPLILTDCCARTSGLQSHLAGLAILARNIGADKLRDAGLNGGHLAAPMPVRT